MLQSMRVGQDRRKSSQPCVRIEGGWAGEDICGLPQWSPFLKQRGCHRIYLSPHFDCIDLLMDFLLHGQNANLCNLVSMQKELGR